MNRRKVRRLNLASENRAGPKAFSFPCPICNLPVLLETAKTDDRGQAIHERCYLLSVRLKHATTGEITPL